MSEFHIDALKRRLTDLARPNLFKVALYPPPEVGWNAKADDDMLLVKSTKLPSITNKEFVLERAGQRVKIPTNYYDFGEATITFYCDSNYDLRNMFYRWMVTMNSWRENVSELTTLQSITSSVELHQYNNNFERMFRLELAYAYPSSISEIEYSHDLENSVETFTVDFKYSYQRFLEV